MSKEKATQAQPNGSSNADDSSKKTILLKKLNCGSCEGLVRHAVLESRCNEVGKLPVSKACGSHRPDVFTLASGDERADLLTPMAETMAQLSVNDLQILAALLLGEKVTRRFGFKFHQKVYVRVRGSTTANYLSNFAVGYILSADKDSVRVIGESGATSMTFINDKDSITLYTAPRFNALRRSMIDAGNYTDPALREYTLIPKQRIDDSVKSFDDAVAEGIISKKKRSERGDLVSLVSRLSKGHLRVNKDDRRQTKERREERTSASVTFKY